MRFGTLPLKNLVRRPIRSVLTMAGIAIGIAAVVALTAIAWGFEEAWVRIYTARGTDIVVTKTGSLNPVPAAFPSEEVDGILSLPHVAQASRVLSDIVSIEDVPVVLVFAWEAETFLWDHLRLVRGRWPADDSEPAVVLGRVAAEVLGKQVGSSIRMQTSTLTVSGIFESASLVENGSVVMTLPLLQRVTGQPGRVNFVNLTLAPDATDEDVDSLRQAIALRWPAFRAFRAGDAAEQNAALRIVTAMSRATIVLAIGVGAVGVMNTMLMSVFERTRELGLLLAVGWRRQRVVLMIVYESLALSLAGGVGGFIVGLGALAMLERTPLFEGKIEGKVGMPLFGVALAIAVVLGLAGGLYPAYRGSRMRPADALRHE